MKVGILAGGLGTRLSEETVEKPKPMVEIGGKPIMWHIMMHYAYYGFNDFVVGLGYKGEVIKRYIVDYVALNSDLTVNLRSGNVQRHENGAVPDWNVELVNTGLLTMTGGRIKRLIPYMGNETFMLTWGDGVATIDLDKLLAFHRAHGKLATLTAVRPPARFGHLEFNGKSTKEGAQIVRFDEKPQASEGWINGAFFVLEPEVYDYIEGDETMWEREPLERLAEEGQLMAYKHDGFWQCMDTLRDKRLLDNLWDSGLAPWKIWK